MDPLTFLQSVAGFTRSQTDGSADRPILLGTVDPAYAASSFPTTLPKVTFDGESTLSGKRYVVVGAGYRPNPGDRVVLVPIGTTYAIIGAVSGNGSYLDTGLGVVGLGYTDNGTLATSSGSEAAIPTASWDQEPSATFRNGRIYLLKVNFGIGLSTAAANAGLVRVRKGAQSTSGQVLGFGQYGDTTNLVFTSRYLECWVKNTSGADISTALSLTVNRAAAANNVSLYGDNSNVPCNFTVEDRGRESGHVSSPIAAAIT